MDACFGKHHRGGYSVETPEIFQKYKIPFAIGISIFVSEFALGWSNFLLGWFPMIFVLGLVIGILTGDTDDGIGVFGLTLVIGNLLGVLIMAIVLAPLWLSGGVDFVALAMMFILAPFYAVTGLSSALTGFALTEFILAYFIVAPGLYLFSFGFFVIGGRIGDYRRDETEETLEEKLLSSKFPKNVRPKWRNKSGSVKEFLKTTQSVLSRYPRFYLCELFSETLN
jgi:hypothetical protein